MNQNLCDALAATTAFVHGLRAGTATLDQLDALLRVRDELFAQLSSHPPEVDSSSGATGLPWRAIDPDCVAGITTLNQLDREIQTWCSDAHRDVLRKLVRLRKPTPSPTSQGRLVIESA